MQHITAERLEKGLRIHARDELQTLIDRLLHDARARGRVLERVRLKTLRAARHRSCRDRQAHPKTRPSPAAALWWRRRVCDAPPPPRAPADCRIPRCRSCPRSPRARPDWTTPDCPDTAASSPCAGPARRTRDPPDTAPPPDAAWAPNRPQKAAHDTAAIPQASGCGSSPPRRRTWPSPFRPARRRPDRSRTTLHRSCIPAPTRVPRRAPVRKRRSPRGPLRFPASRPRRPQVPVPQ